MPHTVNFGAQSQTHKCQIQNFQNQYSSLSVYEIYKQVRLFLKAIGYVIYPYSPLSSFQIRM